MSPDDALRSTFPRTSSIRTNTPHFYGDGETTTTQMVSTKDLPRFGSHTFTILFDATGQAWVRFAAWDSAGNGAMTMPIRLGER